MVKHRLHEDLPNLEDIHFILWYKMYMSHKNGKEYITTQEAYKILADYFQLTNEQRNYLTQSGENDWEARVRSSYNYLKKKGVIESASRGEWALTKKGIELFEEMFPPKIIFRNSI